MENGTILPRKFNEFAVVSVYYQLLGGKTVLLHPVYSMDRFDAAPDGTMYYYRVTIDGSYVRTTYGDGDFVKAISPDGEEIFFHYTQVFRPTHAAQKRMGITAQVLAVAFQNTNRQIAKLRGFIREAEKINATIERLRNFFNDISSLCTSYDPANRRMVVPFANGQMEILEKLKVPSPIAALHTRSLPQLYARVIQPDLWWQGYKWEFFFIDVGSDGKPFKNVVHETRIYYDRSDKTNVQPNYDLGEYTNKLKATEGAFVGKNSNKSGTGNDSDVFDTRHHHHWYGGSAAAIYYRCVFTDEGKIAYEPVCGGGDNNTVDKAYEILENGVGKCKKNVKPYFCGADIKGLAEIVTSGKDGYITFEEAQALRDTMRASIDHDNNHLQGLTTLIAAVNNDLEQSFSVATAAVEASGEGRRRTAANAR
ncbi:MAG: hypothetical protein LBI34_02120 [Puniceicoccales bacterium]|jgi:hypothetical protein|nr:hypothetical protein [Puniceicoccales bacterium]